MGITGALNNAYVDLVSPTTGSWISGAVSADLVCADLFKLERAIITGSSKGIEMPDTLVMPPSLYAYADTCWPSNTETSALEHLLKKSMGIKNVEQWYPLETAGAALATRMLAYTRNPTKVQALMPLEFNQSAPEARNLSFVITCDGRSGGVDLPLPGLGPVHGRVLRCGYATSTPAPSTA